MSRLRLQNSRGAALTFALVLLMLAIPFYVSGFWLRMGILVMAAAVGAIGLDILVGVAGQVSVAHSVFLAAGAYLYVYLSSPRGQGLYGLGLPTTVALLGAVLGSGLLGLVFGPIASRLRGLHLAIATIGLVFIAEPVLQRWQGLSGGYVGRPVPDFSLFGLDFSDSTQWVMFNIPLGRQEKLWFLGLAVLIITYVLARRIVHGRPGLAMHMIRNNEIGAAAMGVRVASYKNYTFILAAMYGGMAGVLLALSSQFVVPAQFDFNTSVDYLVMIILGGLGSVRGAIAGAAFVTMLPILLQQYSGSIPFLAPVGSGGIDANIFGSYLYAGLLIIVIMFARGGLDSVIGRIIGVRRSPRRSTPTGPTDEQRRGTPTSRPSRSATTTTMGSVHASSQVPTTSSTAAAPAMRSLRPK